MENDGFNLGAFLAEQRAEGAQDSEGAFTVSADRAALKLAKFALGHAFDWVLKVVQAANLWKAPKLVVRQTRVASSFFFCPQDLSQIPDDAKIVGSLQAGALDQNSPLDLLCMALRSLVDQVHLSFVLAVRHQGETGQPIYAGDDTSALDAKTRETWTRMNKEGIRLTVSHFKASESRSGRYTPTLSGVFRRDQEIVSRLDDKAYASTTAVVVDGRRLTDIGSHSALGFSRWSRPLRVAHLSERSGDFVSFDVDPQANPRRTWLPSPSDFSGAPWYTITTSEWRAARLARRLGRALTLAESRPHPDPHALHWVRYGVVVRSKVIFNASPGARLSVFIPADDYRTDLTGLAVEAGEERGREVKELVERVLRSAQEFHQSLSLEGPWSTGEEREYEDEEDDTKEMEVGHTLTSRPLSSFFPRLRLPKGVLAKLDSWSETESEREALLDDWLHGCRNEMLELDSRVRDRINRAGLF